MREAEMVCLRAGAIFASGPARTPSRACARGPHGSLLTHRWREMDSNPRSPVRSLTQTRSNGDVQHPCAASRMTIGTQIGFAIGGFAPGVAAAVHGEGPNAWVAGAPVNSPVRVGAS